MTTREQAITAIQELPEDTDLIDIIRELSFMAGVQEASAEMERGEGMNAGAAKKKLREWIAK